MASKQNYLTNVFYKIDQSLSKFYSSRPRKIGDLQPCQCKIKDKQKKEQIQFYTFHKQMISEAASNLLEQSRTTDERVIGKILFMAVDYITKILELLGYQFLCQCKKALISQSTIMKYKLQFMRVQNDKFFKLFQQKNAQCESLTSRLNQIKGQQQEDVRPLTARGQQKASKQNYSNAMAFLPKSVTVSEKNSAKSSQISEFAQTPREQIKNITQRAHGSYFNSQIAKKQKRNKIFSEIQ